MPQYHLPLGNVVAATKWNDLDAFTKGYIECMFFTENSPAFDKEDIANDLAAWEHAGQEGQSDGTIPGDASFDDLEPESLERIIEDCSAFQGANAVALELAYGTDTYDAERAGNDYWYSRNGHGVGYWDRGLGGVGDVLHAAAKYHEVNVWYDPETGKVHVS